jgi:hypothetical protein
MINKTLTMKKSKRQIFLSYLTLTKLQVIKPSLFFQSLSSLIKPRNGGKPMLKDTASDENTATLRLRRNSCPLRSSEKLLKTTEICLPKDSGKIREFT